MRFEWDPNKEASNQKKHRISFDEAETVFFDENALVIPDPDHSNTEDRFIILGLSRSLRELVVCHCFKSDDLIRIISARKANKQEAQGYWENR